MQIVKYPHPTLRHRSKPIRRVDADLKKMVREMFELMYANKGVGLAANQVDLPYRLIVANTESDPALKEQEHVFINPVILERKGGMEEKDEGCLSLPEIYAPVRRPTKIVVNAYNQTFKIAREALEALRTHYAEYLLDSVVRQCTKFAQASSEGCPIFGYDPDSKGANDIEAMQDEILGRVRKAARAAGAAGA